MNIFTALDNIWPNFFPEKLLAHIYYCIS
jgi:hypothetical protein